MTGPVGAEPIPSGKPYAVDGITVYYDATRCRHFAECMRGLPEVFDTKARPWIRPDRADVDSVAEVVRRCPTGALHYRLDDGPAEEPVVPTRIVRVDGGPLMVRGDLVLDTPSGELRETRAALCACGDTTEVPFCDGACEARN